jgi:hypothetical protein
LAAACKSRKILVNAEIRIGMRKHPSAIEVPEQPLEKPIRILKRRGRCRLSGKREFSELTAILGIGRRGGADLDGTRLPSAEKFPYFIGRAVTRPILTSSDANIACLFVSQQIR